MLANCEEVIPMPAGSTDMTTSRILQNVQFTQPPTFAMVYESAQKQLPYMNRMTIVCDSRIAFSSEVHIGRSSCPVNSYHLYP